jgi:hypothetical protein
VELVEQTDLADLLRPRSTKHWQRSVREEAERHQCESGSPHWQQQLHAVKIQPFAFRHLKPL